MPELPEVETTVRDLKTKVLKRTFVDVWTDFKRIVKKPKNFERFKKEIKGKKIKRIWRRGKNILFGLSKNKTLLIHLKLTGHLLLGKWRKEKGDWKYLLSGALKEDPMNRFLHLIFWINGNFPQMIALSDLRKFAKVELWDSDNLKKSSVFKKLGPEPLKKSFNFKKFKEILSGKKGKIKQVLMNQEVIAGIGNIYSDEILWEAKIHPLKEIPSFSEKELKRVYLAIKKILKKAIKAKGESFSDFRRPSGEKGKFDPLIKVYRKTGKKCICCRSVIKRIKLGGRSAHFCPKCQKI